MEAKLITRNLQKKIPIHPKRIKEAILKVFSQEALNKPGEITVSFVTDRAIRKLNSRYLKQDRPTDVLAFDISGRGAKEFYADIVVSAETAIRNSRIFKTTPEYEIFLYAVHGALHLCGYEDDTDAKGKVMQQKAVKILSLLKITS
ncbi:MAG TPA: rRNA maturation RNase YbeY [Candidatus Margulisiibacteriota bacterium]|nr:rRNA maturation RNase YbeY [Candidatus Margulisiibacteriota bacterium]